MFIKFLNYRLICLYFKNIKVLMRTFNMSLVGPVYAQKIKEEISWQTTYMTLK